MGATARTNPSVVLPSIHGLGVLCGLAAGVWLGAAEAPTKLVNSGLSPYAISLCMVAGVFTARWTVPTMLKGTRNVFADLSEHRHLIPIAILAGMLWAVANTLTVFAIRDVGLAIAFPLWNTNSSLDILWGRVLFGELERRKPREHRQGCPGCRSHRRSSRDARLQHHRRQRQPRSACDQRHPRRHRCKPSLGHHVRALSQGLHQRHEPALVRNRLHHRRTRRTPCFRRSVLSALDGGTNARRSSTRRNTPPALLAFPRRIRLG